MAARLEKAGFSVTRVSMTNLTQGRLLEWTGNVRKCWEEFHEYSKGWLS
jgi:hypothetical protein